MRVLHVVWRLSVGGGIPRVVREVLSGLDRDRYDLHVVSVRPRLEEDRLEELGEGITYHFCDQVGAPGPRMRLETVRSVRRITKTLRPDLVHTHASIAWYTLGSGRRGGGRRSGIVEWHDAPQSARNRLRNLGVQRWLVKAGAFHPVVHSSSVRNDLVAAFGREFAASTVIPLGIDTSRFAGDPDPGPWRAAVGIPEDARVVLYVARVVESKNHGRFLDVAERVLADRDDTYFVSAGGGSGLEALRREVERRGMCDRVKILGYVDDVVESIHGCDLFLSTSDYEGFGLALAEAMAAGKPVVSTRVGGVADVVDDPATGFLVDPGDLDGLAEAVARLLDDADLRAAMGAAGRRRARTHLDTASMVARYDELYQALTG